MAQSMAMLEDKDHQNWLRLNWALKSLKEGIEAFTDKRVVDFHQHLHGIVSQQLGQQHASICNTCTNQRIQRRNGSYMVKCPSNLCNIWLKAILLYHENPYSANINHANLKPQLWPTHPWEVAKCYMPRGRQSVTAAKDADLTAILGLFRSCSFMHTSTDRRFLVHEVSDIRNQVAHSNNMTISDHELKDGTDKLIQFLNRLVGLTPDESSMVQRAIDNIIKLRNTSIDLTYNRDGQQDERQGQRDEGHGQQDESLGQQDGPQGQQNEILSQQDERQGQQDERLHEKGPKKDQRGKRQDTQDSNSMELMEVIYSRTGFDFSTKMQVAEASSRARCDDIDQVSHDLKDTARTLEYRQTKSEMDQHKDETAASESTSSWERQCKDVQQNLLDMYNTKSSWEDLMTTDQQCFLDMYVPPAAKLMREKDEYGGFKDVNNEQSQTYRLSYQQIFSTRSGPCTNVYITGDAGTGKTTFCNQLVLTWCMGVQNVQSGTVSAEDLTVVSQFKLLFYINLRDTETIYHVENMIKEQLLQHVPMSMISTLMETEKCLIVLDGLDEWSCPDGVKKCTGLNKHIPGRNIMNKNCVFLTTTRKWKYDVSDLRTTDVDKHVELFGIDEKSSKELSQQCVGYLDRTSQRETNIGGFDTEIRQKNLSDFIRVPVLLKQLITLWHFGKYFGNSQLQLYCGMLDLLFERSEKFQAEKQSESAYKPVTKGKLVNKQNELPNFFSTNTYCQSHTELLMCLAELAYMSLFTKQREEALVFKSSKLHSYGISSSDIDFCLLCGIFSQNKDFRNYIGRNKKLSFLHKTMQEFLAALHIVTVQPVENTFKFLREFCDSIDLMIEMSKVWLFVSGMNPDIARQLLKHFINVITADTDKQVLNYRQCLGGKRLIRDIQTSIADCVTEGYNNGHTYSSICLDDVYVDMHTFSQVKRMLLGNEVQSLKSMHIDTRDLTLDQLTHITDHVLNRQAVQVKKLYLVDPESRIPRGTLTTFFQTCNHLTCLVLDSDVTLTDYEVTSICHRSSNCLMALRFKRVRLTHIDKVKLLNELSQLTTIRQLDLRLECTDHYYQCRPSLDISTMTQLKRLDLSFMYVDNLPTVPQCLEQVDMWGITLPMTSLCEFALRISQIRRHVEVQLDCVTVREESVDPVDLGTFLRGCRDLTVTHCYHYSYDKWTIDFHTNRP